MCVFRYRQHSSRDKPLGPHPLSPHPLLSLHPPCLVKCVCICLAMNVCVFMVDGGLRVMHRVHSQGATEKTAVFLRETENLRKGQWRANRDASQDRHFWSEYRTLCHPPPHAPIFLAWLNLLLLFHSCCVTLSSSNLFFLTCFQKILTFLSQIYCICNHLCVGNEPFLTSKLKSVSLFSCSLTFKW